MRTLDTRAGVAAFTAGLSAALTLAIAPPTRASPTTDEALQAGWRETMAQTPTPGEGCFRSDYPSTVWNEVGCVKAPARTYLRPTAAFTVGNGNDYAAVVPGKITSTVGSFTTVTGVTTETGGGAPNSYSLQINSQFFASPACAAAASPASCSGWQQFIYDSQGAAFMQYWLIGYGASCPSGWISDGLFDCYKNSQAVTVPREAISALLSIRMSGTVVAGGTDKLVFTVGTQAYNTTGKDNVLGLAGFWHASEWNIFGDGNGDEALFNKGASIRVRINLTDSPNAAPTCQGNDGTTGETNNLTLGPCVTGPGGAPFVAFTESRAK